MEKIHFFQGVLELQDIPTEKKKKKKKGCRHCT